jgi:two-component system sensor kinase FixL
MKVGRRLTARLTRVPAPLGRADRRHATSRAGRYTSTGPLLGMGVLGILFLVVVLLQTWYWTCRHIDDTAARQAHLAVEFGKSLRNYVGKYVRPEMEKRVNPGEFIPEAMSTSFVARSVLDDVRTAFPDTVLHFASRHPRNPANRAAPAEEALIRYFEQHPDKEVWSGTMEFIEGGAKYFVCAVPRRFEASCLQCHGRPADAPAALLARYGTAGFGRSVGEVSVDLAAIPVSASYAAARTQVVRHMLIALGLCLLFLAGIAFLIRADARRRRSAARAVEQERNLLRLVIDTIPDFVWVKSREGRYVIANEALAQAYGTTVRNVQGRRDTDFSPTPEQVERYRRDDLEVIATRNAKRVAEEPLTYADGSTHWLTTTKVPLIREDGGCDRLLAVATDITGRKGAEEKQIQLFQKLSEINQELKDFAYVVSHDLKAPLRAIRTLADWLATDYQDKLDAPGKENLQLLSRRVERMQNLIDGVLQYSRVGRTEEETVPVDLSRVVPEIIEDLAAPAHIAIRIETDLPVVDAHPTRITQVFQNLLSNAIKYMDKPQGNIAVGCVEEESFWRFHVSDNGPGIAPKDFERIFKLFQTLTCRDDSESTGVGLTITRKIVELYGGKIWVESETGQGSTFFFTFPKRTTAAATETLQTCTAG